MFFLALIFLFLALDLGVFNKNPHIIKPKEAGIWTGIWVSLSFIFSIVVGWIYKNGLIDNPTDITPSVASMKFITGYLIELSLSVDNIFVIAVIFASFKIPQKYQHRVLFWGILGAIVFRGLMIFFGVILINKFSWMTYLFGAFLIFTAFKMLFKGEEEEFNPKKSFVYVKGEGKDLGFWQCVLSNLTFVPFFPFFVFLSPLPIVFFLSDWKKKSKTSVLLFYLLRAGQILEESSLPALKRATFLALILITAPVCGLRPVRAALLVTEKVPKPTRVTLPPPFKVLVTAEIKESSGALS